MGAQRERTLFSLSCSIVLYDLTNTYFEGRCACNQYGGVIWPLEGEAQRLSTGYVGLAG
jgi:hypothetical protein